MVKFLTIVTSIVWLLLSHPFDASFNNQNIDNDYNHIVTSNVYNKKELLKNSLVFLNEETSDSSKQDEEREKEISKEVMITLVLIITSFGMTSIGVFYILKDRKMIK